MQRAIVFPYFLYYVPTMQLIRSVVLLPGFLLLLLKFPAIAENSPPVFNLQAAIQYALQNNLDIRVLQNRRTAAQAEILVSKELNNPSFVGETTRSKPNYFVGAGYLFELGGKRGSRVEIARNEAEIAELNLRAAERTLRHDVRAAFYQILQSRLRLQQLSLSRDLASKLLDISQQRFEAGDVPRLEVLQAQLELKRRENDLQQAENEFKKNQVGFNLLLNRLPEESFELQGGIEDQPVGLTLDALVQTAIAQRMEIRTLEAERKAEEARLSLARKERIPDLQMEGGTEIHDDTFQYGWRANVSFDLPVFNLRKGEIASAMATLESLRNEEASQKQKVRSEVTEAYLRFQTAAFRVQNFRKVLLPAAAELEELSRESYREGKTSLVSALDAQRNSQQVQLEYLDALLDYQTVLADLEKSAGIELP